MSVTLSAVCCRSTSAAWARLSQAKDQHEFSPRFYANARAGLGIHLYRTDRFASEEKQRVPGADLNFGVRF